LSEINKPAFGSWRAPSSGTVIPAHIAADVRNQSEAMKVQAELTGNNAPTARRASNSQAATGPNYQKQMVKELKNLANAGGNTVNNVTVTSSKPVGDAQRLLLDVNRLSRYRRR
jgi:hypothetical protein